MRLSKRFVLLFAFCVLSFHLAIASNPLPLPKGPIQGQPVVDLPAPSGVQSVKLKNSVAISWNWKTPEVMPNLVSFGFEIRRQDGKVFETSGESWTDTDVGIGSYTYVVRARGETKSKAHGQHFLSHVSDWSYEVSATFVQTCNDPPQITLQVETTQKEYASIPSLRMHMTGWAVVPEGCHLLKASYRIDDGTGILHTGLLDTEANGHFDAIKNAIEPDDEIPTGVVNFAVSVTAEDESGPATSADYKIDVELKNPFAPHSD